MWGLIALDFSITNCIVLAFISIRHMWFIKRIKFGSLFVFEVSSHANDQVFIFVVKVLV